MLYAIYAPDGSILQANKIWHASDADAKFEDGIRDLGQKFVKRESEHVLSPELYYVDVTAEALVDRPIMPVVQSTKSIKAGTDDAVLFTDIPTGASYSVRAGSTEYLSGTLDDNGTEIELSVPVPCTCTVVLTKWPFQTLTATVEVHA